MTDQERDDLWTAISERCARATTERVAARRRAELVWEKRFDAASKIALSVGVFLIVQFPLLCLAFEKLEISALEACSAL
ncbi:MAG: hypothetical protein IJM30_08885 [Thermoguttaceae bacterium]|nr:hypothetical protein [Thermoguttaceae bacterium]